MKSRNLMLMGLAVVFGLGAAYLTANMGPRAETPQLEVLVAAQELKSGMVLKDPDKQLKKLAVLKSQPLAKGVIEAKDILKAKDKIVKIPIPEGGFVTEQSLTSTAGLLAAVPRGMRAFAIKADISAAVGGWITPGSKVDVIATVRRGSRPVSKPILEDILVLAVDNRDSTNEESKAMANVATVTVAVAPAQATKLALAHDATVQLKLALRAVGDDTKGDVADIAELLDEGKQADEGVKPSKLVKVLMAKQDIKPGTKIVNPEEVLELKDFPEEHLPRTAIKDFKEVAGKTLHRFLPADQVCTQKHFEKDAAPQAIKEEKTETLTIINGTKVDVVVYKNGAAQRAGDKGGSRPSTLPPTDGPKPEAPAEDGDPKKPAPEGEGK